MAYVLLGVVVGAVATGSVTYRLERRREARAFRGAARLVRADLAFGIALLAQSLKAGTWYSLKSLALGEREWAEHKTTIAIQVSSQQELQTIITGIQNLLLADIAMNEGEAVTDESRERLANAREGLVEARDLLKKWTS